MKDCYEFYVTDTNLLFDTTAKNISDFLSNESAENQYFNNIRFCILECKNALLIKFSYGDTKRDDILNVRILKNKVDRPHIYGNKAKLFHLMFGLLKESVDKYERSKKLAFETIERDGSGYVNLILQTKEKLHKFLDEMVEKWK